MPSDGLVKEVIATSTQVISYVLGDSPDLATEILIDENFEYFCVGIAAQIESFEMDESWDSWARATVYAQTNAMQFIHEWLVKRSGSAVLEQ